MNVAEKIEIKNVKFSLKQFGEDPDFYEFSGYASTFDNIDRGDDAIQKGAFTESIKEFMPKLLWQHDMSVPIGVISEIFEDETGLYIKGKMPKDDDFVKGRVMPQLRAGSIDSMSIGFNVEDAEVVKGQKKSVRNINKVKLWEVSLVTIPMNPLATVRRVKSAVPFQDLPFAMDDGDIDFNANWDSSAAISRIRESLDSEDSPSEAYKTAFLWYDETAPENYGSYKLPIADIVDGRLAVIPRAIFASAAALQGARGGVDIPEGDRDSVIRNVNRYYDKMDRPSPFEKSFSAFFETMKSLKEFERFLNDFGLSNKESKAFISELKRTMRDAKSESSRDEDKKCQETDTKQMAEIIKQLKEMKNV